MDLLQVRGNGANQPVRLRGTCVGGWMNMEDFIDGYPGAEHSLRAVMADLLGPAKAQFFFDRLLDYFLAEDDIAFLKACGATVVRLPLNYRHFESDAQPFHYLAAGFERLDRALGWCAKHGLYAILDLHSVQGWQNTDWHCDNGSRHALFWQHPHFQDRWVVLWEELARRYQGQAAVAGYNVMNEPIANAVDGRFSDRYQPNWPLINGLYRRIVGAIHRIDPDHIIFLEGDNFSRTFAGLEPPFAANLVYSSHNYTAAGFGPGPYPGTFRGERWDRAKQAADFAAQEGTRFTQQHQAPLWVGEFGAVYNGPAAEIPDRLRAMDDQLAVLEDHGAHWTTWTYKDVGIMGWVTLKPESEYLQAVQQVIRSKLALDTDFWMGWLPLTPAKELIRSLARLVEATLEDPEIDHHSNVRYLTQAALSGYVGGLMQPEYARIFKDMSETQIDKVLQSFAFRNCQPHQALVDVLRRYMA
jgi:endoglucanase